MVIFEKLTNSFDSTANPEYSLMQILQPRLIFNLLPKQDKLILSIDRAYWKFGQTNINIFMPDIGYKGVFLYFYDA